MSIQLYHGDCLEILPTLEAGSVDCVITDPPYGISLDASYSNSTPNPRKNIPASKGYGPVHGDAAAFDMAKYYRHLEHIPEQLWWGADYYLPDRRGGSWFVWDKRAGMPEFKYTLSEFELCWSRQKKQRRIFRVRWFGLCGTETQDVRQRVHPCQKPVELMELCITAASKAGATILDPFAGSGTTGVACVNTGRSFIGIEIDEGYFKIAKARIEQAQADKAERDRQTELAL